MIRMELGIEWEERFEVVPRLESVADHPLLTVMVEMKCKASLDAGVAGRQVDGWWTMHTKMAQRPTTLHVVAQTQTQAAADLCQLSAAPFLKTVTFNKVAPADTLVSMKIFHLAMTDATRWNLTAVAQPVLSTMVADLPVAVSMTTIIVTPAVINTTALVPHMIVKLVSQMFRPYPNCLGNKNR